MTSGSCAYGPSFDQTTDLELGGTSFDWLNMRYSIFGVAQTRSMQMPFRLVEPEVEGCLGA